MMHINTGLTLTASYIDWSLHVHQIDKTCFNSNFMDAFVGEHVKCTWTKTLTQTRADFKNRFPRKWHLKIFSVRFHYFLTKLTCDKTAILIKVLMKKYYVLQGRKILSIHHNIIFLGYLYFPVIVFMLMDKQQKTSAYQ